MFKGAGVTGKFFRSKQDLIIFKVLFSPVVEEESVPVDLVFQGEVEGEILDALVVVNLDSGRVLVGLEVLDDVREPDGESVEPGHNHH